MVVERELANTKAALRAKKWEKRRVNDEECEVLEILASCYYCTFVSMQKQMHTKLSHKNVCSKKATVF